MLSVVVPAGRKILRGARSSLGTDGSRPSRRTSTAGRFLPAGRSRRRRTPLPTLAITAPHAAESFPAGARVTVDVTGGGRHQAPFDRGDVRGGHEGPPSSPCRTSSSRRRSRRRRAGPHLTGAVKDVPRWSATASVAVTATPQGALRMVATALRGDSAPSLASPSLTPVLSPGGCCTGVDLRPVVDASDEDGIDTIQLFLGDDATEPCLVLRMPITPAAAEGLRDSRPSRRDGEGAIAPATDRSGDSAEARAVVVVRAGLRVAGPTSLVVAETKKRPRSGSRRSDVEVAGDLRVGELHLGRRVDPPAIAPRRHPGRPGIRGGRCRPRCGLPHRRLGAPNRVDALAFPDREATGLRTAGSAGSEAALRWYGLSPALPGARRRRRGTSAEALSSSRGEAYRPRRGRRGGRGARERGGPPARAGIGRLGLPRRGREHLRAGRRRWRRVGPPRRGAVPSPAEAAPSPGALAAGGRISSARLSFPLFDCFGTQPGGSFAGQPGTIFVRDALSPEGILLVPVPGSPGTTSPGGVEGRDPAGLPASLATPAPVPSRFLAAPLCGQDPFLVTEAVGGHGILASGDVEITDTSTVDSVGLLGTGGGRGRGHVLAGGSIRLAGRARVDGDARCGPAGEVRRDGVRIGLDLPALRAASPGGHRPVGARGHALESNDNARIPKRLVVPPRLRRRRR